MGLKLLCMGIPPALCTHLQRDGFQVTERSVENVFLNPEPYVKERPDVVLLDVSSCAVERLSQHIATARRVFSAPLLGVALGAEVVVVPTPNREQMEIRFLQKGLDRLLWEPSVRIIEVTADSLVRPRKSRRGSARGNNQGHTNELSAFGGRLRLNPERHQVLLDGKKLRVKKRGLEMLGLLMQIPGSVCTRAQLAAVEGAKKRDPHQHKLWCVDTCMRRVRHAFRAAGVQGTDIIRTVYGVGYSVAE